MSALKSWVMLNCTFGVLVLFCYGSESKPRLLENWGPGWSAEEGLLQLQVDQESRLKDPLRLKGYEFSAMLRVKGEGNLLLGLERNKEVALTWKISFSKLDLSSYVSVGGDSRKFPGLRRPDTWMRLEMEGSQRGLSMRINGEKVGYFDGVRLEGESFLRVTSEGRFQSIKLDEASLVEVSGFREGMNPLPAKAIPLPEGWIVDRGYWSVLPFPGEDGGFFTQSSSVEGRLDSPMVFLDSMKLDLRCRMEGEGSFGIAFVDRGKSREHLLWFRYHPFGFLLEQEGPSGKEVLLREEPSFFPGLWYDIELSYERGNLSVTVDGMTYKVPLSLSSGSGLSLISKGSLASFFKITKSRGWVSLEEAEVATEIKLGDMGVKAGEGWIGTTALRFEPQDDKTWLKVDSQESEWLGMSGFWKPGGSSHLFCEVLTDDAPRLDFVLSGESWWGVISRLKGENDLGEEAKLSAGVETKLGEEFLKVRKVIATESLGKELNWSMRVFREGREKFLLFQAGGKRLGVVSFTLLKEVKWRLASQGKADLQKFELVSGLGVEREALAADGRGLSLLGGGFGTSSLEEDGAITLAEPLLDGAFLKLLVTSPSDRGRWSFDIVDHEGKVLLESLLDFREPPFSLFHLGGEDEIGVVDELDGQPWQLSVQREGAGIVFTQNGESFGPVPVKEMEEPLFLRFSKQEGELEVSKLVYGWEKGSSSDFLRPKWAKNTMEDWVSSSVQDVLSSASYGAEPLGPAGALMKKSGLARVSEVYLKRIPGHREAVGARHRLSWQSEENRVQVLFLQLDEGLEVELSINGASKGKVLVEDRAFSFLSRFLPGKVIFWLGGEKIFEEKVPASQGWDWSLIPEDMNSKGLWSEVFWRNL